MIELQLSSVRKEYNPGLFKKKVLAVDELTVEVEKGEVFGLIGPNGAGKSTTIRMVLGLIRPDKGKVYFRGQPVKADTIQNSVGYLPENPYLYDHLTLLELLVFSGKASGLTGDLLQRRCDLLMEKLSMKDARNRPLRTFSKGMLQRAGICFALIHDPAVVVLDEPMSGLDPVGRNMVAKLVGELKDQGKTIFFCSHILSDVERLCDRIGLMVKGRLVKVISKAGMPGINSTLLHLVVSKLNSVQHQQIAEIVDEIVEEKDTHVLSFVPGKLSQVTSEVNKIGVDILASRAQNESLEELFMKTVEEAQ